MYTLDRRFKKDVLFESFNTGIGFAYTANKKQAMPFSHCKEIINLQTIVERTGIPDKHANYNAKPRGCLKDPCFLLSWYKNGIPTTYQLFEKNYKRLPHLLNKVEEDAGINFSTIEKIDENLFALKFDPFWASQNWTITLFVSIIRNSYEYKKYEDYKEYLANNSMSRDTYLFNKDNLWNILKERPVLNSYLSDSAYFGIEWAWPELESSYHE